MFGRQAPGPHVFPLRAAASCPHPHPDPDPHTCLCVETTQGVCGSHTGAGSVPVDIGAGVRKWSFLDVFWSKKTSFLHGKMSFSISIKEKARFLQPQVASRAGPARPQACWGPPRPDSGRHSGPGTPDPASKVILATKRHGKGPSGASPAPSCTEFQAGASYICPGGWGATFFRRFFEGGTSKILGGGLSGGKKWESPEQMAKFTPGPLAGFC